MDNDFGHHSQTQIAGLESLDVKKSDEGIVGCPTGIEAYLDLWCVVGLKNKSVLSIASNLD